MLRQDRLKDIDVSGNGTTVTATASGSQAYTVQLDLRTNPPSCNCNCPSGRGNPERVCKHSLGLLLWRCEQLDAAGDATARGMQSAPKVHPGTTLCACREHRH